MRMIAPNIHSRIIAVLCFAVGLAGQLFFVEIEQEPARFLVHPVVFVPFDDTQPEDLRNISEYEYGGIIEECSYSETPAKCLSLREQGRKFVLANWKAKRKSYIVVDYFCVDCFPENKIFIEPDENGAWHIFIWQGPDRFWPSRQWTAVGVKRKRATADDWGYKKGQQMLVFVDANGERVGDF